MGFFLIWFLASQTCDMDTPIEPAQNDFYRSVNEKWLSDPENRIPDEYSSWGGFVKLADQSLLNQIKLVEDLRTKDNLSDEQTKLVAIWDASMERFKKFNADEVDTEPIKVEFSQLDQILGTSVTQEPSEYATRLSDYLHYTQVNGIPNVLDFDKGSDLKNAENVVLDVGASGLSLPCREYYTEPNFEEKRNQFVQHLQNVRNILTKYQIPVSESFAEDVMKFEQKLAKIRMTRPQGRSYDKYYTNSTLGHFYTSINELTSLPEKQENFPAEEKDFKLENEKIPLAKLFLENIYKKFDLRTVLKKNTEKSFNSEKNDSPNLEHVTVYDGDYFRRLFGFLFDKENFGLLRSFHQYKIVSRYQGVTSKELNAEFFDYFSLKLSGQLVQKSDIKRTVMTVNAMAGDMLGKVYVEQYCPPENKNDVLTMIREVLVIMNQSIEKSNWLTEETKKYALVKLSKFVAKIGFPERWKDYTTMDIKRGDSLYAIMKKQHLWLLNTEFFGKLNTRLDRTEWLMTPQTVNAYFMPPQNEIVFPAAILQPPFYSSNDSFLDFDYSHEEKIAREKNIKIDWKVCANFGGIGAVIAHEITHGYDDQGRKYDKDGNINDWWNEKDVALFEEKTKLMATQAELYTFKDEDKTYTMNAKLTMGENLADLGGLSLGLQALLSKLEGEEQNENSKLKKDLCLRVFFKSWANIWKENKKKDSKINALTSDPHGPVDFRGNLVRNIDYFHQVFSVVPGHPMWLDDEKRVKMW